LAKNQPQASSGSFNAPAGQIEPSAFFDEDAEAVRLKHLEEQREEAEVTEMALHDRPPPIEGVPTQEEPQRRVAPFAPEGGIFNDDDATENPHLPPDRVFSEPSSASAPMEVPQTPDVFATLPATPRGIPTTRMHDDQPGEEDHESKRARLESSKKQRVDRLSAEYASMIRAVKISTETFHTMDEYEPDLQLDDHLEQDVWEGEDEVTGDDVPSDLWSSCDPDQHPEEPAEWIARLSSRCKSVDNQICLCRAVEGLQGSFGAISKRWLRR
jgi:hypothetical protein